MVFHSRPSFSCIAKLLIRAPVPGLPAPRLRVRQQFARDSNSHGALGSRPCDAAWRSVPCVSVRRQLGPERASPAMLQAAHLTRDSRRRLPEFGKIVLLPLAMAAAQNHAMPAFPVRWKAPSQEDRPCAPGSGLESGLFLRC